jgi:hypothetical protein
MLIALNRDKNSLLEQTKNDGPVERSGAERNPARSDTTNHQTNASSHAKTLQSKAIFLNVAFRLTH